MFTVSPHADEPKSGHKIFSIFAFEEGTNGVDEELAGTIGAEAVSATPGLRFFSGGVVQSSGAEEATDLVIRFTVTAPGRCIEGLSLEIAGTTDDNTIFSLQGFAESAPGRVDTRIDDMDNQPTDSVGFAPVTSLDILAGFSAFSAGDALISLDEYTLTVRQTPLPASVWLLLGGLGALVGAHRQKQRARVRQGRRMPGSLVGLLAGAPERFSTSRNEALRSVAGRHRPRLHDRRPGATPRSTARRSGGQGSTQTRRPSQHASWTGVDRPTLDCLTPAKRLQMSQSQWRQGAPGQKGRGPREPSSALGP